MLFPQRFLLPMVRWATLGCGLIAAASSLLAVGQVLGWHPVYEWIGHTPPGLFFNPAAQGAVLALVGLALLAERIYWLPPLLIPGLWLSQSRGGWATLAFGLIAGRVRQPITMLVLAIAATAYWTFHPSISDLQRLAIWRAGWSLLTFWGHGFGSFWFVWIGNPAWWPQYAHNDYLQTVFEFGIWSAIPFTALAWLASRSMTRHWPTLVAAMFMSTFFMPLHVPFVLIILAIVTFSIIVESMKGLSYGSLETTRCALPQRSRN